MNASQTSRKGTEYAFTDGENSITSTCARFSRRTGIDISHVVHLAKGRTRSIYSKWRCLGWIEASGKLVPIPFKGKGFKSYSFRKITSSRTVIKTRSDFARMAGIPPMHVYRASRKLPAQIGSWIMNLS